MKVETVGILMPGDMGHAVGNVLRHAGLRVITVLTGRSERTAALARQAGIEAAPDDAALVREAQIILSIVAPAGAPAVGERIAGAVERSGAEVVFVECNAIAPSTVRSIAERVTAAGARFVDAGIIGGPPKVGGNGPRFYASGHDAEALAALGERGLDIRVIGAEIGQASGLKMCYAALTKGLTALATELLVAGEAMGLSDVLDAELKASMADVRRVMERSVPGMPPKAHRWVREMEEIALTFADLGLTPNILQGAADMYRLVAASPLGRETPESRQLGQSLGEVVAILNAARPARDPVPADD